MDNFIDAYIVSKLGGYNPKVTKIGNEYICKYLASNKRFDASEYRHFKEDSYNDITYVIMEGIIVISLTGLLCMIPHVLGVIAFTLVNMLIIYKIACDNRYEAIVHGTTWLCMFLIALFCIHFTLASDVDFSSAYKVFHTIYPEYLFKFKFK